MNWIRISVSIMRDQSIIDLAEALGVSTPTTTGHVVGVLTALPEGSKGGDLSAVSDLVIERWAHWTGKRGRFAAAFRSHLCTPQGVVRSWDKYNGAALREMEADRERKKAWREQQKIRRTSGGPSGGRPADDSRTSTGRPPLRDETRRDETNYVTAQISSETQISAQSHHPRKATSAADRVRDAADDGPPAPDPTPPRPRKPKAPTEAKWPTFALEARQALHAEWQAKLGAVSYPQWIAAVGPLFGGTVLVGVPPDEIARAYRSYLASVQAGGSGTRFASPAQFAKLAGALVQAARDYADDPAERLAVVDRIVHGRAA